MCVCVCYQGFDLAPGPMKEIQTALIELESYHKHIEAFGVKQQIHIDVGLAPQTLDFHGAFFEMILVRKERFNVIGTGGR